MSRRSYHQFCGVARALDLVGERWTLLIVRDLLLGPRRYSELLSGLPGITTNLLAKRLKTLAASGIVAPTQLDHNISAYALTPLGAELEDVVLALGRFGQRWLDTPRPDDNLDVAWAMVSLKRRYVGTRSGEIALHFDTPAGPRRFQVRFSPDHVEVRSGSPWAVGTTATLSLPTLRSLFTGEGDGAVVVRGERGPWEAFVEGFGLSAQRSVR